MLALEDEHVYHLVFTEAPTPSEAYLRDLITIEMKNSDVLETLNLLLPDNTSALYD